MFAFWSLTITTVLCYALGFGWRPIPWLGKHGSIEALSFSGVNVDNGKWWVFVTALFCHADLYHVVNNVLMTALVYSVEAAVGSSAIVLGLFLAFGVAGWLLSYVVLRADEGVYSFMKFADTVGSSPSTYGVLVYAALVVPGHELLSPIPLVPPWLLVSSMLFLQLFRDPTAMYKCCLARNIGGAKPTAKTCSSKKGLWLKALLQLLNAALLFGLSFYGVRPIIDWCFGEGGPIPLWTFAAVYVVQSLWMHIRRSLCSKRTSLSQSNEVSHLGGCASAFVVACLATTVGIDHRPTPTRNHATLHGVDQTWSYVAAVTSVCVLTFQSALGAFMEHRTIFHNMQRRLCGQRVREA